MCLSEFHNDGAYPPEQCLPFKYEAVTGGPNWVGLRGRPVRAFVADELEVVCSESSGDVWIRQLDG